MFSSKWIYKNSLPLKQTSFIICEYFNVGLSFDESKPNGDMKRIMSTERAESYGFTPKVDLKSGLEKTINWYINSDNR